MKLLDYASRSQRVPCRLLRDDFFRKEILRLLRGGKVAGMQMPRGLRCGPGHSGLMKIVVRIYSPLAITFRPPHAYRMDGQGKRFFTFGLCLWFGATSVMAKPSASELLDEIIRAPGRWSQMCASPPPVPFDVPIPLYSLATPRFHSVSKENLGRLQKRRPEIVAEVVSRLGKIDLMAPAQVIAGEAGSAYSGQDPGYLTGLILQIILELKIVEALPGLLRLEAELALLLKDAEGNKNAKLPPLDLDSPLTWKGYWDTTNAQPQEARVFTARVYQSELLAVMASLLRAERFEPLLRSEIEAYYLEWLKRQSQGPELANIKRPEDVPKEQKRWITFDPIYNCPISNPAWHGCWITNTPKVRLEIRKLVKDYLKSAPNDRPAERPKPINKK